MMTRSLPSWTLPSMGLVTALSLVGCASMNLELVAPPPSATSAELTLGRRIYVTKCAKCHAPEPVKDYSQSQWQEIMPEMIEETNLSASDAAAVTAYVNWVLKQ